MLAKSSFVLDNSNRGRGVELENQLTIYRVSACGILYALHVDVCISLSKDAYRLQEGYTMTENNETPGVPEQQTHYQQQAYYAPTHGQNVQQAYGQPAPEKSGTGKALGIAAMVIGILSVLISFIPLVNVVGIPLALLALILGIVALALSRGGRAPLGFGIAGTVLGVVALILTVVINVVLISALATNPDVQEAIGNVVASVEEAQEEASSYTSYEEIYNDYSLQLQNASISLVEELREEAAANTEGGEGLASIMVDKTTKLANILASGELVLAEFMEENNSDYKEYSEWAEKLTEIYNQEANKLYDVYLEESAAL